MRYYYSDFEEMFNRTRSLCMLLADEGLYGGHTTMVFADGFIVSYEINSKS